MYITIFFLAIFIITCISLILMFNNRPNLLNEHFNGALTQLFAKGPQDIYLTADAIKYIPPWYYPPHYLWNMPTRYPTYYYPLLF